MKEIFKEVVITRNEAGRYKYEDNKNRTVETGDKAFMVTKEDFITEETENLYFINRNNCNVR